MSDKDEIHRGDLVAKAKTMLAEARSISEVKEIRDQAEAMRVYMRQRDEGKDAQNIAAEIKIRAERRMGELLKEMPKAKPSGTNQHKDRSCHTSDLPTGDQSGESTRDD